MEGAEGIWEKGNEGGLKFRVDAEFSLFKGVEVDGKALAKENYEAWSGSTYVELAPTYLETLSEGRHTLRVLFNDGEFAQTNFTVQKNPKTGDNSNALLWIVLMGLALTVGILGVRRICKKQ